MGFGCGTKTTPPTLFIITLGIQGLCILLIIGSSLLCDQASRLVMGPRCGAGIKLGFSMGMHFNLSAIPFSIV